MSPDRLFQLLLEIHVMHMVRREREGERLKEKEWERGERREVGYV